MDKNLFEKADKYATGKANEAITNAIAQAYVEGYKAGYNDRELEIPVDLRDNKTEYVDLGLPSGTLWATKYESIGNNDIIYTYDEVQNLNIPTKEQVEELLKYCKIKYVYKTGYKVFLRLLILGPNGNSIEFNVTGYKGVDSIEYEEEVYFWIKEYNGYNAWRIFNDGNSFCKMFTGYRLKARLVR